MLSFDVVGFRDVELVACAVILGGPIFLRVGLGLAGSGREFTRSRCTACSTEGKDGCDANLLPGNRLGFGDAFLVCCLGGETTFKLLLLIFGLVKGLLTVVESLTSEVMGEGGSL